MAAYFTLSLRGCCAAVTLSACHKPPVVLDVKRMASAIGTLDYFVRVDSSGTTLSIQGELPPGATLLKLDDGAAPFADELEAAPSTSPWESAAFAPLARGEGGWNANMCARGCRIRYRFRLAEAARAIQDGDRLLSIDNIVIGSASAWLVHPASSASRRYRFRVDASQAPSDVRFVTGVTSISRDVYGAAASEMEDGPYTAFGMMRLYRVRVSNSTLTVALAANGLGCSDETIVSAIRRAAEIVTQYLGFFPVNESLIVVTSSWLDDVRARTSGGGGSAILVSMGPHTHQQQLSRGVLTHELMHLALPYLRRDDQWFAEGLATYTEAVARTQSGELSNNEFWTRLVQHFPEGLPRKNEWGLTGSTRTGRIYWGGALFFLLADIELRTRTMHARSIIDVLRAIHAQGGSLAEPWTIDRVIEVGDQWTGTRVMRELYARMSRGRVDTDLDALWVKLGIETTHDRVRFNNSASLADVRRRMFGNP